MYQHLNSTTAPKAYWINEADVALDVWAVLDGRREDGFRMGSEPLVQVRDLENNNDN